MNQYNNVPVEVIMPQNLDADNYDVICEVFFNGCREVGQYKTEFKKGCSWQMKNEFIREELVKIVNQAVPAVWMKYGYNNPDDDNFFGGEEWSYV